MSIRIYLNFFICDVVIVLFLRLYLVVHTLLLLTTSSSSCMILFAVLITRMLIVDIVTQLYFTDNLLLIRYWRIRNLGYRLVLGLWLWLSLTWRKIFWSLIVSNLIALRNLFPSTIRYFNICARQLKRIRINWYTYSVAIIIAYITISLVRRYDLSALSWSRWITA
jgi:hypothetical protein